LRQDGRFQPLAAGAPELDIVVWKLAAETREQASELAQKIFVACAARDLHLALIQLPLTWFQRKGLECADEAADGAGLVTCLRSVLMKPEHEAWLDRIWERWIAACAEVLE
jgi:hypothetical protein